MWRTFSRKHLCGLCLMLFLALLSLTSILSILPISPVYALTKPMHKPALSLNRAQGPLGVTLTLRGTNFPAGQASLSYIDAKNVPGVFAPPSDSSVEVLPNGSFLTTNLVLPATGPVGAWKIVVTDNSGALNTIRYSVLAAKGQTTASAPTLSLTASSSTNADPPEGASGNSNAIFFTGTNWLPKGTAVKLTLLAGASSLPLLEPLPVSDALGNIAGSFYLPASISVTNATVTASDMTTGALRSQVPITITNGIVSLTPAITPQPTTSSVTPVSAQAAAASSTGSSNSNSNGSDVHLLGKLDAAVWGPILLVAGGMLAVAGLMLILFMLPWSNDNRGRE